jgi:hypothetical protein
VRRARVILLSAAGAGGIDIAVQLDLSPEAVSRIRRRFVEAGVDGLLDQWKAGRRDHAVPADTVDLGTGRYVPRIRRAEVRQPVWSPRGDRLLFRARPSSRCGISASFPAGWIG